MKALDCKLYSSLLFAAVIASISISCESKQIALSENALKELVLKCPLNEGEEAHYFILSQYQCKGCVERVILSMQSESLRPILESSCWLAPHPKPSEFEGLNLTWHILEQTEIEKIIPFAANITYIRLEESGATAYQELGVEWVEVDKLEQLFK